MHPRYLTLQGRKIRYFDSNPAGGNPILLLHGMMVDAADISWSAVFPELAQSCRVVAPDLPGFGGSEPPHGAVNANFYAQFIRRFCEQLQITHPAIAGIGVGSRIAMEVGLFDPKFVRKLALISFQGMNHNPLVNKAKYLSTRTPGLNKSLLHLLARSQKLFKTAVRTSFFNHSQLTDELVVRMLQCHRNSKSIETYTRFHQSEFTSEGRRSEFLPLLPSLKVPTMVIHGQFDLISPAMFVMEAFQSQPQIELRLIPRCGHWVSLDRPETTASFLLDGLG